MGTQTAPATVELGVGLSADGSYESLWRRAEEAKEAGRLQEALEWYTAALAAAERGGDRELVDRALCNQATVAIALGATDEWIPRLREILLRNGSEINCYLAAYHASRAYELRKEPKKSLFYGRIARQHASRLGEPQRVAAASNQIANALLADSCFEEAACTYREALQLLADRSSWLQICSLNLAYCELVIGQRRQPLTRLFQVLRDSRRSGDVRLEMIARIDLCYASLELGRLRSAERFGLRGLMLAQEVGEVDWIKNALFLLGEVAVQDGRTDEARERFEELQRRFYPGHAKLADLLVGVDVRQVINLRA